MDNENIILAMLKEIKDDIKEIKKDFKEHKGACEAGSVASKILRRESKRSRAM